MQFKGDVDNDGKINMLDAMLSLKAVSDAITLDEEAITRGDVNNDGKVSLADVRTILKHISGKELIDEVIE